MPKYKSFEELAKLAEKMSRPRRPRITTAPAKQFEKVEFVPKATPTAVEPVRGSEREADQLIRDLDRYIDIYNVDPETYPSSVRNFIWKAAKNGTYGPRQTIIQRTAPKEVPTVKDYFKYGPRSTSYAIDNDLRNATTTYDLVGTTYYGAPELSRDFLNSALTKAEKLVVKPAAPEVKRPRVPKTVQNENAAKSVVANVKAEEPVAVVQSDLEQFRPNYVERPVTTVQSDVERFYVPDYYDGPLRSTYDTTSPESFEDMYRRLTGYSGKLWDKDGGKLKRK